MVSTTGFESLDRILEQVRTNSKGLRQQKENTTSQKNSSKNYYDCLICKDTSWLIDVKGKAKRCDCFNNQHIKDQWLRAGLKLDDLDKTFKSYKAENDITKKLRDTASNYWFSYKKIKDTKNNSILLAGSPGAGKTHLSIALANNFISQGIKVVYMPYRDVLTSLKQNMLEKEIYNDTVKKYKEAQILLIDDLFKGKITETDINIMFEIVNYRYINKKPIICSTEHLIATLLSFDEAIASRLYEMSKGHIYEVKGNESNYRLKG